MWRPLEVLCRQQAQQPLCLGTLLGSQLPEEYLPCGRRDQLSGQTIGRVPWRSKCLSFLFLGNHTCHPMDSKQRWMAWPVGMPFSRHSGKHWAWDFFLWELISWSTATRNRERQREPAPWESQESFETSKPVLSDTLPPTKNPSWTVPAARDLCAYGSHSLPSHHSRSSWKNKH